MTGTQGIPWHPLLHPSLDLRGGRLTVLAGGALHSLSDVDPGARADYYARHGPLNVIDLDLALGSGANDEMIQDLCRRHECYVGGGVRTPEEVRRRLRYGARKVILGSAPFAAGGVDRSFLAALARVVPRERVVFALDARAGEIMTGAWTRSTGLRVEDAIGELEPFCSEFVLTAIEREGGAAGPDFDLVRRIAARTRHPLLAAGGVATIGHVLELVALGVSPVVSQAIHVGELDLTAAFLALYALDQADAPFPTTVCDRGGGILAAYESNRQSLALTLRTGECFKAAPEGPGSELVSIAGLALGATRVRVARAPTRIAITGEARSAGDRTADARW